MNRLAVIVSLVVALAGCSQGHDELMTGPDIAVPTDMSMVDFADPMFDLLGPSCGQMVLCIFKCGVTNLMCDQTCVQGAQPTAIQQAGALTLCAAQNCLSSLTGGGDGGGGGGMFAIIQCLEAKCPTEVNSCDGLPFAGAM